MKLPSWSLPLSASMLLVVTCAPAATAHSVSLFVFAAVFVVQVLAYLLDVMHHRKLQPFSPEPKLYCVVTGASSGIGEECVRALARRGFNLAIVARRVQKLTNLSLELQREHGVDVVVIALDLSSGEGVSGRIVQAVEARGGFIGALVYAAGVANKQPFNATPLLELQGMVRLNAASFTECVHAVAPGMVARGRGRIMVVGSIVGVCGQPFNATYAATKAFMSVLSDGLNYELGLHGVGVTCLAPGHTTGTEFADRGHSSQALITYLPGTTAAQVGEMGVAAMLSDTGVRLLVPGAIAKFFFLAGLYCPHSLGALAAAIFWNPPKDILKNA